MSAAEEPAKPSSAKPAAERRDEPGGELDNKDQSGWKLSFVLFVAGFLLLIFAAKRDFPPVEDWSLKALAAALCAAAFFLSRRTRQKPKPSS